MFREEYIKDNELIKPDDDFLRRLKESVKQEDEVVHIGDYVDYDNAESFEKLGREDTTVIEIQTKKKRGSGWKTFSMIAACFVLICTIAFAVGRTGMIGGEGLQAGMESALSEELYTTEDASDVSEECIELYNKVYDLFVTNNVVIYEMDSYVQDDNGIESLEKSKNEYRELDMQERDELIGDILANNYSLVDTTEEFDSVTYYLAEFENQTCVVFAIDSNQFIYVVEVSGIQNMAWK